MTSKPNARDEACACESEIPAGQAQNDVSSAADVDSNNCCAPRITNIVDTRSVDDCCAESTLGSERPKPIWYFAPVFVSLFVLGNYILPSRISAALSVEKTKTAEAFAFFVSHSIGLIGILGMVTTAAIFVRSFIDEDKVRSNIAKVNTVTGHGIAAGIGVATPFCSCSAVPVFTGFVRSGVPVSQAISFLVASPLVNEIAIALLAAWIGWQIAAIYAIAGFTIAVVAGLALRRFATPELTEVKPAPMMLQMAQSTSTSIAKPTILTRLTYATAEALELIRDTWIFVLVGVGVGAGLHGWLPTSAISEIVALGPVLGVIAATALGVPLYSGIATVLPVISVLEQKGMPIGTLLAFAMSVTALSLPEALLLRKVMKPKLLGLYFGTVAIGIVLVGVAFNFLLK